jgi:hypothetical protein
MDRRLTIISGGQTGADRAALDFAIAHGFPHDGWCPLGRRAEDGPLAERYQLRETESRRYTQRTRWNVRDSDATVVLTIAADVQGGSALTLATARRQGRPALHLSLDAEGDIVAAAASLLAFLDEHQVRRLNVAGPRASQEPRIADFVHHVLSAALLA